MKDVIEDRIKQHISICKSKYPELDLDDINIAFGKCGHGVIGQASKKRINKDGKYIRTDYTLTINSGLFEHVDWLVDNIDDLIRHELGHLIAYKKYPNTNVGHGNIWRSICKNIGHVGKPRAFSVLPEQVSKSLSTRKMTVKRHLYVSADTGKEYRITTTLHNKFINGKVKFADKSLYYVRTDEIKR